MLFHMECTNSCKWQGDIRNSSKGEIYNIFLPEFVSENYSNLLPEKKLEKYSLNLELQATVVLAFQNTRKLATSESLKIVKQVVMNVCFLKIYT